MKYRKDNEFIAIDIVNGEGWTISSVSGIAKLLGMSRGRFERMYNRSISEGEIMYAKGFFIIKGYEDIRADKGFALKK